MKNSTILAVLAVSLFLLAQWAGAQTVDKAKSGSADVSIAVSDVSFGANVKAPRIATNVEKVVGEQMCFTLTARDSHGNIIRSWRDTGQPTTLSLKYGGNPTTTANTDTSTQSWNADPLGYTFAQLLYNGNELAKLGPDDWSIPADAFDSSGQATVCLVHTRADTGVYIEVTPTVAGLHQESVHVNFRADVNSNFLVELTSSTPKGNQVFHERPYEIVVTPRDRFLNPTNETIRTRFTARFPGEFDSNFPGLADIFSGDVFITGPTNYLIASRIIRELPNDPLQFIEAYAAVDQSINGQTNPYEILSHAPNPFALLSPPDHYSFTYMHYNDVLPFSWERPNPPDPYTDIQISRFDPRTYSDVVTYTFVAIDSVSLTRAQRIASDNSGSLPSLTLTHLQVAGLVYAISGQSTTSEYSIVWKVEATDGLYTRMSSPPYNDPSSRPGFYLFADIKGITGVEPASVTIPTELALGQNYPNPFNPTTNISFSLPSAGKATIKVYDLVGNEVATVVDEPMRAGDYTVPFDASRLPSGIYLYKIRFGDRTITRRMTLMK